jgi:16S rRNA (cytosine967-C5)-methyltransferase
VQVLARDVSQAKVDRLLEQIQRLHLTNVTTAVCDGTQVVAEDIGSMDMVLLDAPCSGLGVLARKKDICYAMTLAMQHDLEQLQRALLSVAADKVKAGGTLLYSTCTVNQGENRDNVEWFLKRHKEYTLQQQIQLLPGVMPTDGFYMASLKKKEE